MRNKKCPVTRSEMTATATRPETDSITRAKQKTAARQQPTPTPSKKNEGLWEMTALFTAGGVILGAWWLTRGPSQTAASKESFVKAAIALKDAKAARYGELPTTVRDEILAWSRDTHG